jgi:hypothetical protein
VQTAFLWIRALAFDPESYTETNSGIVGETPVAVNPSSPQRPEEFHEGPEKRLWMTDLLSGRKKPGFERPGWMGVGQIAQDGK